MTEIAERRVPAFAVVETLGVLEDALRAAAWVEQRFLQAGRLSRYRRPRLALPECSSGSGRSGGLNGVSADSATDAWAVGHYFNPTTGAEETLALHWNGTSWSRA